MQSAEQPSSGPLATFYRNDTDMAVGLDVVSALRNTWLNCPHLPQQTQLSEVSRSVCRHWHVTRAAISGNVAVGKVNGKIAKRWKICRSLMIEQPPEETEL
jgi:hypothetical protein